MRTAVPAYRLTVQCPTFQRITLPVSVSVGYARNGDPFTAARACRAIHTMRSTLVSPRRRPRTLLHAFGAHAASYFHSASASGLVQASGARPLRGAPARRVLQYPMPAGRPPPAPGRLQAGGHRGIRPSAAHPAQPDRPSRPGDPVGPRSARHARDRTTGADGAPSSPHRTPHPAHGGPDQTARRLLGTDRSPDGHEQGHRTQEVVPTHPPRPHPSAPQPRTTTPTKASCSCGFPNSAIRAGLPPIGTPFAGSSRGPPRKPPRSAS